MARPIWGDAISIAKLYIPKFLGSRMHSSPYKDFQCKAVSTANMEDFIYCPVYYAVI